MPIDRRSVLFAAGSASVATLLGSATSLAAQLAPGPAKIELRYAFSVSIFFRERITIRSNRGRAFVPAEGGEVWGPRLQGRVLPYGGADYAASSILDAHYQLQASDGALIYINNRGTMKRLNSPPNSPQPVAALKPGEKLDQVMAGAAAADVPLRMRLTPIFDAPVGPHDWLSRTLIVGHGARYVGPDHTIFTYYEVL
jgi:hypothetical protein